MLQFYTMIHREMSLFDLHTPVEITPRTNERSIDKELFENFLHAGESLFGADNTSEQEYHAQDTISPRPLLDPEFFPLFLAHTNEPLYYAYQHILPSILRTTPTQEIAAISTTHNAHTEVPFKTETIYTRTPHSFVVAVRETLNNTPKPYLHKPNEQFPRMPYAYRKIQYDIHPHGQLHTIAVNMERRDEGFTIHAGKIVSVRLNRIFVYSRQTNTVLYKEFLKFSQPKGKRVCTVTIETGEQNSHNTPVVVEFGGGNRQRANRIEQNGVQLLWYNGPQNELAAAQILPDYELFFRPALERADVELFLNTRLRTLRSDWNQKENIYPSRHTGYLR